MQKKLHKIIVKENCNNKKIRFIKFDKNLSFKLKNFDIIAGPSGTMTYEAISSGTLPFSFPLKNDGRDSMISWNLLGNIMHLNHYEKNKREIILDTWDFIFRNFKKLSQNLKKSHLVKNNSTKVVDNILKYYNNRSLLFSIENLVSSKFKIKNAGLDYTRSFLISRNRPKVREVSSNPKHIISWNEHLNWWLNKNVKKFVLVNSDSLPLAYHWVKKLKINEKHQIIISGWFPDKNEKNMLKVSHDILTHQKKFIMKNYRNCKWIININKNNLLSIRMNKELGFLSASKKSKVLAKKIFGIDEIKFKIFEMNL